MAQYSTVVWQPGDEVTSQKLQQMASNTEWLKDNIILGNINHIPNAQGRVFFGSEAGIFPAKKIEIVTSVFDSQVPAGTVGVEVDIPQVFTKMPVCIASIFDVWDPVIVRQTYQTNTKAGFYILNIAGAGARLQGHMNIMFIGE